MVPDPPVADPAGTPQPAQNVPHPDALDAERSTSVSPGNAVVPYEQHLDAAPPSKLNGLEPRRVDPMPFRAPLGPGATAPQPRVDVDVFMIVTILVAVCVLCIAAWFAAG